MPNFTQRHYETLADFIGHEIFSIVEDREKQDAILRRFVYMFNADNKKFNDKQFVKRAVNYALDCNYRESRIVEMPYGEIEVQA